MAEPAALSEFNEWTILFISWEVQCSKLNLLYCVTDYLMAVTLWWIRYVSMIFATVVSSSKRIPQPADEDGLVPEYFFYYTDTMLIINFCEDIFITY